MIDQEEIIRYVEVELRFKPTPETKFFWGTGVARPDGLEFIEDFADHYGVDTTYASRFVDYGDSDTPLADIFDRLWKRLRFKPVPRKAHFTIDHLVEVANRKKWFDPVFS